MQEIKRNLLLRNVEADWKAHGPFPSTGMVFGSRGGSGYCFPPHPPWGLLDDHGGGRESPSAPPHSSQTQAAHPASSISSPWATPHSQGSCNHPHRASRRPRDEMAQSRGAQMAWPGLCDAAFESPTLFEGPQPQSPTACHFCLCPPQTLGIPAPLQTVTQPQSQGKR